ncbi:MAG: hypothetical protein LCH84_14230 [Gemmatimonadetes bacterium]|nr:hypothetical protein [Gemmatimonadota bacterium]
MSSPTPPPFPPRVTEMPPHDPREVHTAWRETSRTGRYAWVGANPVMAKRLWFVLHGYGQLAERFLRPFIDVVPEDTTVVAIEGLNRFYRGMPQADGSHLQHVGANWMTRDGREHDIRDSLDWLDTVHRAVAGGEPLLGRRQRIGVLAFSQGVAMASRWLARDLVTVDAFVAWAGTVAADIDDATLARALGRRAVTFVCGDADPFFPPEAHTAALTRLQGAQPATEVVRFAGAHLLDADTLGRVLAGLPVREGL